MASKVYAIAYPHDDYYNLESYGVVEQADEGSWEVVKDGFETYDGADQYVKEVLKEDFVLNDIPF